jgi:hypothetical protein
METDGRNSAGPGTFTGTVSLLQTIGLWGSNVTLSGSEEIEFDFGGWNWILWRVRKPNQTIDVKTAVA